ncbi:TetR/AcrR family transcriptional regulator [Bacillus sp. CGMCC 1.16541]|uniref:TetR/AcrR family transcriptional regulator n=1 Tax=Bacillus sp. CGMCC 1.16541 TaxID=2185143 RepID=UPI0013A55888|nr:TetR/AcrR family transcriptional regulator [Bacillus sp. CGMCC 1.16541]
MKEKERLIIEAAIKLFAKKGFNSTSVQEIVELCNISKGSFYIYFKSKDALLLSILNYYHDKIATQLVEIKQQQLEPRENYKAQLKVFYNFISENKNFIIMQIREKSIPFNDEIEQFIHRIQRENVRLHQENLLTIYGDGVTPYIADITKTVEGIYHSYLEVIIFNHYSLDFEKLVRYILNRVDNIVEGLLKSKEEPILPPSFLNMYELDHRYHEKPSASLHDIIEDMKVTLDQLPNLEEDLHVSFDILKEELEKEEPKHALIQGMLANLKEIEAVQSHRVQIAKLMGVKVL